MPTYEFECPTCGNKEDRMLAISQATLTQRCLLCNSILRRIYSPVNAHFKGSGFYETDYKRKEDGDDKAT